MKPLPLQLLLLGVGSTACRAQDSLVYSTRNPIIVERYCFYRPNSRATSGTFRYDIDLDGNRLLRGSGSFTMQKNKIFMSPFRQVLYELDWRQQLYQARDTTLRLAEEARISHGKLIPRQKVSGRPAFYQEHPTPPAAAR